jgi:hypothetical protein
LQARFHSTKVPILCPKGLTTTKQQQYRTDTTYKRIDNDKLGQHGQCSRDTKSKNSRPKKGTLEREKKEGPKGGKGRREKTTTRLPETISITTRPSRFRDD